MVTPVATGIAAFVGRFASGEPDVAIPVTSAEEAAEELGPVLPDGDAALALRQYFANGGTKAYAVRVGDGGDGPPAVASLIGSAAEGTGLHALAGIAEVDVVCLPDACYLDADAAAQLYADAAGFCEDRRAFLLVDPPAGLEAPADLLAWVSSPGVRHRNVAMYVPQVVVADPLEDGATRAIGASASVAGVIARTDAARGVWKAPAGVEAQLADVVGLAAELGAADQEQLNPAGVSILRTLPGAGRVVWGARTLIGDSTEPEWRYVSVRRLALFIERSVAGALRAVEHEVNDEPLWRSVREDVRSFLQRIWNDGGLQGQTPQDAYFVQCGLGQTMSPSDVAAGVLVVEIGIAPLRPAEFVVLRFRATAGSDDATDADPIDEVAAAEANEDAGRHDDAGRRLLYIGPPRSGRTAAARELAARLGRPLVRVDAGRVTGRYIGETEKNLSRILASAEAADEVLLFDEADALFGRRQVRDRRERGALTESTDAQAVARLIARLERHPGVVILASQDEDAMRASGIEVDVVVSFPSPHGARSAARGPRS